MKIESSIYLRTALLVISFFAVFGGHILAGGIGLGIWATLILAEYGELFFGKG